MPRGRPSVDSLKVTTYLHGDVAKVVAAMAEEQDRTQGYIVEKLVEQALKSPSNV